MSIGDKLQNSGL